MNDFKGYGLVVGVSNFANEAINPPLTAVGQDLAMVTELLNSLTVEVLANAPKKYILGRLEELGNKWRSENIELDVFYFYMSSHGGRGFFDEFFVVPFDGNDMESIIIKQSDLQQQIALILDIVTFTTLCGYSRCMICRFIQSTDKQSKPKLGDFCIFC